MAVPPVPYQSPVAGSDGIVTQPWAAWFRQVLANITGGGTPGTVTSTSVVPANGFAGSVANATTTPEITLSTTITGLVKGNGTALSAQAVGDLTDVGTDGITVTGGSGAVIGSGTSIAQHVADSTHNGYLNSTDWITFNNKQASGSYITALTGDGSASGPGSVAITFATVNSNVGSFGSSTSIPTFTVNAKGLVTAASGNAVVAPAGTLTGTTLASGVVTSSLTAVGTISTGVWNGTTVDVAHGGTGQTSYTDGQILIGNSTGNTLSKATITAGSGISVTNGGGTITIAASGGGLANPTSEVLLTKFNSLASTNTKVLYYVNNTVSGTDMSYTASSVNGDKVVINTAGVYCISANDNNGAGILVSKNSSVLSGASLPTTAQGSLLYSPNGHPLCVTLNLAVNDIIRVQANSLAGQSDYQMFRIVRVN